VPHSAVNKLIKLKLEFEDSLKAAEDKDRKPSRHTAYHDKLIKNVVWNRQRLQST